MKPDVIKLLIFIFIIIIDVKIFALSLLSQNPTRTLKLLTLIYSHHGAFET